MTYKPFFKEWDDSKFVKLTQAGITITMIALFMFLYVVIAAPYIEEKFFRQMANFTSGRVFLGIGLPYGDILGVLFSSGCFALFHGTAFGWNNTAILSAFAFAIFVSVGNQLCKSAGFGFGAHFINNYLVYAKAVI